ncbi:hypothetical protein QBC40DRAFT_285727 [Triangularia verruculosa]|uniref:Uncharacterized protein n=1 Tax=Triangularia verruculosa TaxID=2587418 RepID=A0AAN7ASV7_9PEZI|nr:hypothetical protein QBC40DRAFT_285727 [Triangularia verruculosa]
MMSQVEIQGSRVDISRFFTIDNQSLARTAYICQAVTRQIDTLRNHAQHGPFFEDVLTLIETKLLRIAPEERARTGELVDKFHGFYKKSLVHDGRYCAPISINPSQSSTTDSLPRAVASGGKQRQNKEQSWVRRLWEFLRGRRSDLGW